MDLISLNNSLFINGDIYIRRDSTANKNYIECTHADEHDLVIEVQDGKSITLQTDDGSYGYETLAKFQGDGAADLYYNGNKKIETTDIGVTVTGTVTTTAGVLGVGDATKAGTNAWTGVNSNTPETIGSAASITIDFSTSNNFKLTTGHGTIQFENPDTEIEGQSGSIFITQGSTTCAAPSWGDQFIFAGGAAPSLTATEDAIARIDYIVQEAGKIHCVATDNLISIPS